MSFAVPVFAPLSASMPAGAPSSEMPAVQRATRPVPPHLIGTRAALFHVLRAPMAEEAPPSAPLSATGEAPAPASKSPDAPKVDAPKTDTARAASMVSGVVTARFAYAMAAKVRLAPQIAALPPTADTALPATLRVETTQARQNRLKDALMDDMFIF